MKEMQVLVSLEGTDKVSPKLEKAIGIIKRVESATAAARSKLQEIGNSGRMISGVERMNAEFAEMNAKLKETKDRLSMARAGLNEYKRSLDAGETTKKDFEKAEKAVRKMVSAYDNLIEKSKQLKSAIEKKNEALTARGINASDIAGERLRLEAESKTAIATINRGIALQNARTRAAAMRGSAASFASGGASLLLPGYAITRGLGGAVSDASEFNSQVRQIGITADMTDAKLWAFRDAIIAASAITGQSSTNLLGGAGFLIAAGASPEIAQRSITTMGKVATAYKADILDIAKAGFVLNDTLKIAPEALQGAFSVLARAGKEGNVELRDMAQQLPLLGAGFAAIKMQGTEATATMAAALEIARKGAPNAEVAANNMNNFLAKMMSPETLKKAKANFGLDLYSVITSAQKSGKNPFEAAIAAIAKVTKGGDQKLLGELFQDMQVQAFLRPMLQFADDYKRIKAEALGAAGGGMIDQDFARVARDMDASTSRMGNAWESLKLKVGTVLKPVLEPLVDLLARATVKVVEFANANPNLTKWLAVLAGLFGVLLVVGGGLMLTLAAVLLPMATLSVLAATLGIGLLPLVGIIAAVGAAIAGVVWVFTTFSDQIGGFFSQVADLFQNGNWIELGQLLTNTLIDVLSAAFMGAVQLLFVTLPKLFVDVGIAVVTGIVKGLLAAVPVLLGSLSAIVDRMTSSIRGFLGIKSPSRVFAEIGAFTAAGLAMGIANGTPSVVSTAETMANQVSAAGVPAFGAGGGAGSGGGMSIGQVTIVIEGGAGDPAAIARAVEDRLRALNARNRSEAQARFYQD